MLEAVSAQTVVDLKEMFCGLMFWLMSGAFALMILAAIDLYFHEFSVRTHMRVNGPDDAFAYLILGPVSLIIPAILCFVVAPIYAFRKWMKWESVEVKFDERSEEEMAGTATKLETAATHTVALLAWILSGLCVGKIAFALTGFKPAFQVDTPLATVGGMIAVALLIYVGWRFKDSQMIATETTDTGIAPSAQEDAV